MNTGTGVIKRHECAQGNAHNGHYNNNRPVEMSAVHSSIKILTCSDLELCGGLQTFMQWSIVCVYIYHRLRVCRYFMCLRAAPWCEAACCGIDEDDLWGHSGVVLASYSVAAH